MTPIFPGMDPYLEDPRIWPGLQHAFMVYCADQLQWNLSARYIAAVEERVFIERPNREALADLPSHCGGSQERGAVAAAIDEEDAPIIVQVPLLEVHQPYVTLLDRRAGQRVVTVIELVSPTNKDSGPGRTSYQDKQREVLASDAHLVEIDLLRAGPHVLAVPETMARARWTRLWPGRRADPGGH